MKKGGFLMKEVKVEMTKKKCRICW